MAWNDDSYFEPLFALIKTTLREHEEGMYEEELIDQLQPAVAAQYTVDDFQEAIDLIDDEVVVKDLNVGRFLQFKK